MESNFRSLARLPEAVSVETEAGTSALMHDGRGKWQADGVDVLTRVAHGELVVELAANGKAIWNVVIRWQAAMAEPDARYLGDAWERAYGDLEWRRLDTNRFMPWYFLATDGTVTDGYGVKTGAAALCYWTIDTSNIVLHADVRCGGLGVQLGKRKLNVCTVVSRKGATKESPFAAAHAFCKTMCARPRLPKAPVYGFNDWYCTYGHDTADNFLRNVAYITKLIPAGGNRPFAVVDDGWQGKGERDESPGLWNDVNPSFSTSMTMPEFAREIQSHGALPGLWCRPLIANADVPQGWRLARDPHFLDPSVPAVREHVRAMMSRFADWGYKLIKHDYTTYDILGRWGFDMRRTLTSDGWAFADRSRTTAEIIRDLYLAIREGAGDGVVILGCNTIGHLSAGIFEMQRIGDDTSGRDWARTRKMGVNCLAFRAPQQGALFAVDADCAGQVSSNSVPWEKNSQWLNLLAHSGTPLFVSFPFNTITPNQETALGSALQAASRAQPIAMPVDWLDQRTPIRWIVDGKEVGFVW